MTRPALHAMSALALAAACLAPHPALAQGKAAAETLFDRGRQQLASRQTEAACHSFEDSQRLDPGIGTLLYLADCYEKLGRTASAWATFREAESTAKAAGQAEREAVARKRASALEPRLARIVVSVAPGASARDLEVRRDGEPVVPALWGAPIPIDPGTHRIEASAPGRKGWSTTLDIAAKGGETKVSVPELALDPAAAPPAVAAPASPAVAPAAAPEPTGGSQRTWALVAGGVGVAGAVVGTLFGLQARSKNADASDHCRADRPTLCDAQGVSLGDDAKRAATTSTLAFAVGGVALAGGVALWLTAPTSRGAALALAPTAGSTSAGLVLRGGF